MRDYISPVLAAAALMVGELDNTLPLALPLVPLLNMPEVHMPGIHTDLQQYISFIACQVLTGTLHLREHHSSGPHPETAGSKLLHQTLIPCLQTSRTRGNVDTLHGTLF